MGDFPNHHSFSKEIAESIGLEEAIIFEKIKSEDNKKISKKKLIEVLSYISKSKINVSLHRLEKLNLIENNNESFSLKIIKTRPINTAQPIKDNSASFLREISFQAKQLGIKKKTIQTKSSPDFSSCYVQIKRKIWRSRVIGSNPRNFH